MTGTKIWTLDVDAIIGTESWMLDVNCIYLGIFKFLSNNLRYLCWHGYPLKSLPSNFHPEKLVELDMCFSWLEQLWEGKKVYFIFVVFL